MNPHSNGYRPQLLGSNQPAPAASEHAQQENNAANGNALEKLRQSFFRFNLNEPRLCSVEFNRTPIVPDESKVCVDMNSRCADAMMESQVANETDSFNSIEEYTMDCCMALPPTPVQQQQIVARWPTLGLERTPCNATDKLEFMLSHMSLENRRGRSSFRDTIKRSRRARNNPKYKHQCNLKSRSTHAHAKNAPTRSRSAEAKKKLRTRVEITSFDDCLNPQQNERVADPFKMIIN